jgi:hypothetical protein
LRTIIGILQDHKNNEWLHSSSAQPFPSTRGLAPSSPAKDINYLTDKMCVVTYFKFIGCDHRIENHRLCVKGEIIIDGQHRCPYGGPRFLTCDQMTTICPTCFGLPDTPNKPTRTFYPTCREDFFRREYCDISPDKRAQLELEVEVLNRRSEGILATSRGDPSYYDQWELHGHNIAEHVEYLLDKILLPHFWLKTNEGSQLSVQTRALIALLSRVLMFTTAHVIFMEEMDINRRLTKALGIAVCSFHMPLNTSVEGRCMVCLQDLGRNWGPSPAKISCGHIFHENCLKAEFFKQISREGRVYKCPWPMRCGEKPQSFLPDMKRGTPIPEWLLTILGPPPSF